MPSSTTTLPVKSLTGATAIALTLLLAACQRNEAPTPGAAGSSANPPAATSSAPAAMPTAPDGPAGGSTGPSGSGNTGGASGSGAAGGVTGSGAMPPASSASEPMGQAMPPPVSGASSAVPMPAEKASQ
ncbi:hypothetical protein [Pseudorhodoferax sp. Leaf267]|uniref:hypothetical protein n=1 Tax=Pseudorhodoferax sp. Leaf267 TaxID=1736316 RepID=UPI0006FC77F7|nr:hypothetical protein [Pseudorhodoferax sp. Leaf267]KQP21991.1 hypothetical protein ASF43_24375 [Pseudorhodoferax sp. Leaf267]